MKYISTHEIWKQIDYDNIFSVCVLYAAHGIFIAIKDVYDKY